MQNLKVTQAKVTHSNHISVRCPVCATPISGSPIICDRCDTPHHDDCWSYAEGCAVFGCKKVNFITKYSADDWDDLQDSTQNLLDWYSSHIWDCLKAATFSLIYVLVILVMVVVQPHSGQFLKPVIQFLLIITSPAAIFYYYVKYFISVVRIGESNRKINTLLGKSLTPPSEGTIELVDRVNLPPQMHRLSLFFDSYGHIIEVGYGTSGYMLIAFIILTLIFFPINPLLSIVPTILIYPTFFAVIMFGALVVAKRCLFHYSTQQNCFISSFENKSNNQ